MVVGVLTVLAKVRRKQASKTIHSQSEEENKPHETGAVNREIGNVSTQNYEEGQPTQTSRHNEDIYYYYSEVGPLVVVEGDFYEEARLGEMGDGRDYNEEPVESINGN